MAFEYVDRSGKPMSREEVHWLPPEELADRSGQDIRVFATHEELYGALADIMIDAVVSAKGRRTTMILPVGPTLQYPVFARKVAEKRLSLSELWTFNMDEFLDRRGRTVGVDHPLSFKAEMTKKLFNLLPASARFAAEQMFFPRHDNLEEMDRLFDTYAPDGADLCLAGVGPEGHVAFNEDPNFRHVRVDEEEFLSDRTRLVLVSTSTVDMDALVAGGGDRSAIPPFAVTIGPHDLLRSRAMVLAFFAGRFQRYALREVLFRRPTMHFPGTLCKLKKGADGSVTPRTRENLRILCTREEAGIVESRTV